MRTVAERERLWARELTDEELEAEQAHIENLFDDMMSDEDFEGHSGSPGEWLVERLDEVSAEKRRRAMTDNHAKGGN